MKPGETICLCDAVLPQRLIFTMSRTALGTLSADRGEAARLLSLLSGQGSLLISAREGGGYLVITYHGIFSCVYVKEDRESPGSRQRPDHFHVIGFSGDGFLERTRAMSRAAVFCTGKGITVSATVKGYEPFFAARDGKIEENPRYEAADTPANLYVREETVKQNGMAGVPLENDGEKQELSERFKSRMRLAENYARLSNEVDRVRAETDGRVAYYSVGPSGRERLDRIAYVFGTDDADSAFFAEGNYVQVEGADGRLHSAEITEVIKEEVDSPWEEGKTIGLELLFTEQLGIPDIPGNGIISVSHSDKSMEVQLGVIESLLEGTSKAKYMDSVLGRHRTAGFEDNDLSALLEDMDRGNDHPPNASQKAAICAGINTKDVFLVQGPPGTGKTTVILEWAKYFAKRGRILVTSQSNMAVDNVLSRLTGEQDIHMLRIGKETKVLPEVQPYIFEKKLESLRGEVADNTGKSIKEIDDILKEWDWFAGEVKAMACNTDDYRDSWLAFRERARPLEARHRTLLHSKKVLTGILAGKAQLEHEISSVIGRIQRNENQKGIVRKIAGFIRNIRLNWKMSKHLVPEYDNIVREAAEAKEKYDSAYRKYTKTYEGLFYSDSYHSFFCCWDKMRTYKRSLNRWLADSPTPNRWKLFNEVGSCDFSSVSGIRNADRYLREEQERAGAVRLLLEGWQKEALERQNYALAGIILETSNVIGATCIGIKTQERFADVSFDVTIMDEAGQIQVHNALVPASVSGKLIMLGDDKQIPPMADKDLLDACEEFGLDTSFLKKSLFEVMYSELPEENKIMLDSQYRMPAQIADIVSEWFYGGKYLSPLRKKTVGLIRALSTEPLVIVDTSGKEGRYEVPIPNAGVMNPLEACCVAAIVRYIVASGTVSNEDITDKIGIISGYKSHIKLIRERLSEFLPEGVPEVTAATLDSYQGQERDIIIYSFAKSSDVSPDKPRIGFLSELRRLNVAMTRCKKTLVMVGDMDYLGSCEYKDAESGRDEEYFSQFIRKMLSDVRNGRGDIVSYDECCRRLMAAEGGAE